MKTIVTKYVGPTDRKGSRIIATAEGIRVIQGYRDELDSEGNHQAAARELIRRRQWVGTMVGGGLPKGGMVWVFASKNSPRIVAVTF